jgi:prephenate dehydrogenase
MAVKIKTAIIGCGLMGGSAAKALKNSGRYAVTVYDTDDAVLQKAREEQAADAYTADAHTAIRDAALVVVCLYPQASVDFILQNMSKFSENAVITDICGVKRLMEDAVLPNLRPDLRFIPAHPMAGREKKGFEMSDGGVFTNCNYLIIKNNFDPQAVALVAQMAKDMGAGRIVYTEAKKHDEFIAYTSQLPHAISCAYVNCMEGRPVLDHSAGSLKDVSRVANINASMWSELFIENADHISAECVRMAAELLKISQYIKEKNGAGLAQYMQQCADQMESIE